MHRASAAGMRGVASVSDLARPGGLSRSEPNPRVERSAVIHSGIVDLEAGGPLCGVDKKPCGRSGFDETTLRAGAAGKKKHVLGAFTEDPPAFFLGRRTLKPFRDFGVLPGFAGVAVSDRYVNYFHHSWEHLAGQQACCAHLLRDYQDAAGSWPEAIWPGQAQRAQRGLISA